MQRKPCFTLLPIIAAGLLMCACAAHSPVSPDRSSAPPAAETSDANRTDALRAGGAARGAEDDLDWLEEDEDDIYTVTDPLEGFNRAMFTVNDKLYFWVLKPAARGYRTVVPQPARSGVKNFFTNLGFPIRFVNAVLQGKGRAAEAELTRFLYNSTVGVLGFGNPAKQHPALNFDDEDLGQTLARCGIGDGFYLVWPFFGPSTLRDSFGMLGDRFLDPVAYVDPAAASWGMKGLDTINNTSFRIGDYESMKGAALDPYTSLRDGYLQLRQSKIKK